MAQDAPPQKIVQVIDENDQLQKLNPHSFVLQDTSGKLSFQQVRSPQYQQKFTAYKPSIKLKKHKTYWAKITFKNKSSRNYWILYAGFGDYLELYIPNSQGIYQRKFNGYQVPAAQKDIKTNIVDKQYKFKLYLSPQVESTIYLKLKGEVYNPKLNFALVSLPVYLKKEAFLINLQYLFQGALCIIFIYNLILFLLVRDKTYLYYFIYIFIYAVYYLIYYGFLSGWIQLITYLNAISIPLAFVFYFQFTRLFISTKTLTPRLDRLLQSWIKFKFFLIVAIIAFIYFSDSLIAGELLILATIFFDVFFFLISVYFILKTRSILGKYFFVGSIFLMIGWGLTAISFAGILPAFGNENYFSQIGLLLELTLFSVGLGYRERKNEKDKRLAEEENARILEEQNVTLEREVYQRTKEIRTKNQNLEEKQTQILAQNEVLQQKQDEIALQNAQLAKQHELISQAHKLLSKAHKNIRSSIQSGLRIQKAVLPFAERMQQTLPDHFVLYRPRDIVSGDFYWFEEIDGKQYIVAADCTGHGISGAFMTMLCIQALNAVILQQHVHAPDEILNRLNAMLPKVLKTQKTSVRDGMDVAICVLDHQKKQVAYAGALSPLVIIQNQELRLIKGDIYSINGHRKQGDDVQYTLHTIDVSQPTTLYMFSDGIQDQFGGEQNRKFSSKRLRQLLTKMSILPIAEQHELLEVTIDQWMNGYNQIDDMLLIGMHIE
ncbi:hypothetical protein BKI52_08820 [marine bacterium AO1-C]|nr:hypothetical protein BKI52_08820 [marine bacterium AO1-C]